jgi:tetratricopeptide (TPR) repeat protein
VALLHNNLGYVLWLFEGPGASLEVLRAGIGFAQARGLTEIVDVITASTLDALLDSGELDEALHVAARIAAAEGVQDVLTAKSVNARTLALRGRTGQVAASLDSLESTARAEGSSDYAIMGLGSSALARVGLAQHDRAAALLAEVEAIPGARETPMYAANLPAMVRTAVALGNRALAERLAKSFEPRYPYGEHALVAANAVLAEARGDFEAAAEAYADAAERWERFGVVPERAFALLGQGRCLICLGRKPEAARVLGQARELFGSLGAAPALAEADALLQRATALSSQSASSGRST